MRAEERMSEKGHKITKKIGSSYPDVFRGTKVISRVIELPRRSVEKSPKR